MNLQDRWEVWLRNTDMDRTADAYALGDELWRICQTNALCRWAERTQLAFLKPTVEQEIRDRLFGDFADDDARAAF